MFGVNRAKRIAGELFDRKPEWAGGSVGSDDVGFLASILAEQRPASILEVGVASGLSSAIFLELTARLRCPCRVYGIDVQREIFLDPEYRTGQLVDELCPDGLDRYSLLIGDSAAHAMYHVKEPIEFAFIDGDHLHPWPTFDLLAVLPILRRGAWVAFHDINLNLVLRHNHRNRGSKYVYEHWYDEKRHSGVRLPMIGAIRMEQRPLDYFNRIVDLLFTPHETPVPQSAARALAAYYRFHGLDAKPILQGFGCEEELDDSDSPSTGRKICALDFTADGNVGGKLGEGWSHPERNWTWMTGSRSEIRVPVEPQVRQLARRNGCQLSIDLVPFVVLKKCDTQSLSVSVANTEVYTGFLDSPRCLEISVPAGVVEDRSVTIRLGFEHHTHACPKELVPPSTDERSLSFAVRRLSLRL